MFKIEDLYVEDKRLSELLRALATLHVTPPRVVPVSGETMIGADGKPRSLAVPGLSPAASAVFKVALGIHKTERRAMTAKDARAALKAASMSPGSAAYALKACVDAGKLKRKGAGRYEVRQ